MNKKSFDYIYDLLFLYDEEDYWLECKGFGQLQGYLENLNDAAFKALIDFSKSWSHSFRLNLAEVIIESNIESSFEIYCKMFIEMEDDNAAHWMSGRVECTDPSDLDPAIRQQFQDKMVKAEKYDEKLQEKLNGKGKIIQFKKG